MNTIVHARRVVSCVAINASSAIPRQLPRHITGTSHLAALPAPPSSSESPLTAQKKVTKVKKGPSASKMAAKENTENRMMELMIKAYDAPYRKPPPASEEEMERRYHVGRNYNIGCFNRHNEENHDLAVKIRMKGHALKMLPKEGAPGDEIVKGKSVYGWWKNEALQFNDKWGPPDHRPIPMHTPPIDDFDIDLYMNMEEEED